MTLISKTRDCRHILHIKTLRIDCLLLPPLSVRYCSPREPTKITRIVGVSSYTICGRISARVQSGTIRVSGWDVGWDVGLGLDIGTVPTRSAPMGIARVHILISSCRHTSSKAFGSSVAICSATPARIIELAQV